MLIKNLVQLSHILNYSEDNVKVFDKFIIFTSVSCHWYQLKIITFCITAYVHCGHFLCSVISQGKVVALDRWDGKWNHLSMTHRLTTDCAKNYCNRTSIVKVIVENVVTCFFGHSVLWRHEYLYWPRRFAGQHSGESGQHRENSSQARRLLLTRRLVPASLPVHPVSPPHRKWAVSPPPICHTRAVYSHNCLTPSAHLWGRVWVCARVTHSDSLRGIYSITQYTRRRFSNNIVGRL